MHLLLLKEFVTVVSLNKKSHIQFKRKGNKEANKILEICLQEVQK